MRVGEPGYLAGYRTHVFAISVTPGIQECREPGYLGYLRLSRRPRDRDARSLAVARGGQGAGTEHRIAGAGRSISSEILGRNARRRRGHRQPSPAATARSDRWG